MADKPYYRCQIGSGVCQLFVAHANRADKEDIGKWLETVLMYISLMVELDAIDPQVPGYFHGNSDAASAQNYNLAMAMRAAANWMRGWSPDLIAALSDVSERDADNLRTALGRRADELSVYLED
jgi:hypothetical protein